MRARLACIALVLAGCKVAATGVVVTVTGAALHPDQLRVGASVDGSRTETLVPGAPRAVDLPTSFFAELSDRATSATFDVTALVAGNPIARGTSPAVTLTPHHEAATTIELSTWCAPSAPPPGCDGALLCDGFETESGTNFASWSAFAVSNAGGGAANPGTSLAVQVGPPVCAGDHALHAVAMGQSQQAFVYKTGLLLPRTTHLRAFLYLPAAAMSTASFDLFSFATADLSSYLQLGYDAFKHQLFAFRNFGPEVDFAATLPTDRWICLEYAVDLDAAAGSIGVTVDGVPLPMQSGIATQPSGATFSTLDAGIVFATDSVDLYLDEIALSAAPIGCF
jgi:hypothetical protein